VDVSVVERGVMSSAVEAPTLCPGCGATLPVDPGYSSWCAGCGWNADPYPPAPSADRRGRRTARFLAKLDAQLRASAEDSRRGRPIPSVVTGIALAAAVHALTLALAATAVWLAALGPLAALVRWPLAVALGAIVLLVVPRVPRLPRAAIPLTRDGTPGLWRLVDQVAAAANAPVPSAIVATDAFSGELRIVGVRRKRVLNLGLAAWMTLKPQERVAFLAYELTKTQSGGRQRDIFVGAAVSSLRGWQRVLQPMTVDHRAIETAISWQKDGSGFTLPSTLDVASGLYGAAWHDDPVRDPTIIRAFWNMLSKPLWWLVQSVGAGVLRSQAISAVPRTIAAAVMAANVGSTQAAVALFEHSYLSGVVSSWWRRLDAQHREPDWADLRATLEAVPPRELERFRRVARQRGQRLDGLQPSTPGLIDVLSAHGPQAAKVWLSDSDDAAINRELLVSARR
jgi:hypothetical protein